MFQNTKNPEHVAWKRSELLLQDVPKVTNSMKTSKTRTQTPKVTCPVT